MPFQSSCDQLSGGTHEMVIHIGQLEICQTCGHGGTREMP